MASNVNTFNDIPIRGENLIDPDKNTLAHVLDETLKLHYAEASVEWVTSYPNLSQPPFNLAAEGICGNTALLDFGDESYIHIPFTEMKKYHFEGFLNIIDRNKYNSFIFGHGVFRRMTECSLYEFVLNASFPPVPNREIENRNTSVCTIIDLITGKCTKFTRSIRLLSKLECVAKGTYFLSEGLKNNESVLKVYAKGPYSGRTPFCGSKPLGRVYTVNNVVWKHKCIRNGWESQANISSNCCANRRQLSDFQTMITTFNSSTVFYPTNPEFSLIKLNSSPSIHSLDHHSSLENHPIIYDKNKEEEYVGYFCPAQALYRIDEPP